MRSAILEELLARVAELHFRTVELKKLIIRTPDVEGVDLREGLYQLEAAIHAMERKAADAYRAQTMAN